MMSEWNEVPFSDLLIESRDGEWGNGEESTGYQLCEIIRGTDFDKISDASTQLPKRWIKDHLVERKKLQVGDILLETAGGTANQSTGRSVLIKDSFLKQKTTPVLCASFSRYLRLDQSRFNAEFVYYLLQVMYSAGFMGVFNLQHTGISRFQYSSFKKSTVLSIPELPIQKKLASIFVTYDDLIETNNQRIQLLETMAEEIYKEWFVRLRFPNWENTKAVKDLPEKWKRVVLSDLCSEIRKNIKKGSKEKGLNYIGFEHLSQKSIVIKSRDVLFSLGSNKREFQSGDILFGKIRPYLHKLCLSFEEGACSSDILVIRPKHENITAFLLFTMFSKEFIEMATISATGTKMPRADWKFLSSLEFNLPNEELLDKFHDLTQSMFAEIDSLLKTNQNLAKTRDTLLPRLISGKLSVENLDINFPPSMEDALA